MLRLMKIKEKKILGQRNNHLSCTAVLVGKRASIDGSTMIARNEDAHGGINPKKFIVVKPQDQPNEFKSTFNNFHLKLPKKAQRYTETPCADTSNGIWGESGINSENVAMSATETEFTNSETLAADPLVKDGIGEEAMVTIILPYIHSAKEGVKLLGKIINKYGTCESNGIAFSDKNEIWYLETVGGHHWAAERIPDKCYVIAPNQTGIEEINFKDPDSFLFSPDLKIFATKNHLIKSQEKFNFREIFGEDTRSDRYYNTPRVWFGQKYLNPEIKQNPESRNMPFTRIPSHLISINDLSLILSSHYQGTEFDPYGKVGTKETRHRYRPMGINRNQEMHILQLRPGIEKKHSAIHWLAEGVNIFNSPVPFFANCTTTPLNFSNTSMNISTENFYWLNKLIAGLADPLFKEHDVTSINYVSDNRKLGFSKGKERVKRGDKEFKKISLDEIESWHNKFNNKTAQFFTTNLKTLLKELLTLRSEKMSTTFPKGGEI